MLDCVWLGVSVENQQWADIRVPALLDTPAAVRFLSCEPLLGPVDLGFGEPCDHVRHSHLDIGCWRALDWVIVGGESGPHARPMHPQWARDLRDQCVSAGVPFFYKQAGEWLPESAWRHNADAAAAFLSLDGHLRPLINGAPAEAPRARGDDITMRRVGKKASGRELDGRTWDEYPQAVSA